jgi:hypothetical protein
LIYLACGDPAILNIGVMIDPASYLKFYSEGGSVAN